ncbi:MAG: hypothetical protein J5965_06275, partial [Aeriscardovia sp.]|nr:hypothetical protein [Aeriscardovia sp.]
MKKLLCYLVLLQFMASCQLTAEKAIVHKDIYGYWQLEGEVNKELPWSKIEFINDSDIWIDPCLDTIYHYRHFTITGDSLILTDHQQKESLYKIDHLKDSVLVISDFTNTGVQLRFHQFVDLPDMNDEYSCYLKIMPKGFSTRILSPDSLDVNVKSVLVNEYYEYVKKEIHILSHNEVLMARKILESYFENKEYEKTLDKDRYPYPFSQYVRQYTAIVENGDIIVRVNLMTHWHAFDGYTSLKKDEYRVDDGGPSYATAVINLTKGEVIWF